MIFYYIYRLFGGCNSQELGAVPDVWCGTICWRPLLSVGPLCPQTQTESPGHHYSRCETTDEHGRPHHTCYLWRRSDREKRILSVCGQGTFRCGEGLTIWILNTSKHWWKQSHLYYLYYVENQGSIDLLPRLFVKVSLFDIYYMMSEKGALVLDEEQRKRGVKAYYTCSLSGS